MTNSILDNSTPSVDDLPDLRFVHASDVEYVIDSLDDDMANIKNNCVNGEYVKVGIVFDVLLDVRNKLTELTHDDES